MTPKIAEKEPVEREARLAALWRERVQQGREAKADYEADAKEVESFFAPRHDEFYNSAATKTHFMDFGGSAAVSIAKVAQARAVLVPFLFQTAPRRVVRERSTDTTMTALARILQAYLNYTPREVPFQEESRQSIDDALQRGLGFARTGWDDAHQVVTSWYVSSMDVVCDPRAKSFLSAEWIALRTHETLWRLRRRIMNRARALDAEGNTERHTHHARAALKELDATQNKQDGTERGADDDRRDEREPDGLVTVWTVWSRCGRGFREELPRQDGLHRSDLANGDYVQIEFVERPSRTVLFEGEWEVPLQLDGVWPLTPLAFVPVLDKVWSTSVFAQGNSSIKAMDLLASLMLSIAKVHARELIGCTDAIDEETEEQVKHGGISEVIRVKLDPGQQLSDQIQRIDFGRAAPELMDQFRLHEQEFGNTTGMTEALLGTSTDGSGVPRSAAAANLNFNAGVSRLGTYREQIEEWQARIARNEALCVRLMLDPEDVDRVVRQEIDMPWRVSVMLSGRELPVQPQPRKKRSREPNLSLMDLGRQVARYFETPEEADVAAAEAIRMLLMRAQVDEEVGRALAPDLPLLQTPGQIVSVRKVTVRDVWLDTGATMTPRDLARELGYEIASGSTKRFDPERMRQMTETLMAQVVPMLLKVGNFDSANQILQAHYQANDVPESMRAAITAPAPPPVPMQAQTEGAPA